MNGSSTRPNQFALDPFATAPSNYVRVGHLHFYLTGANSLPRSLLLDHIILRNHLYVRTDPLLTFPYPPCYLDIYTSRTTSTISANSRISRSTTLNLISVRSFCPPARLSCTVCHLARATTFFNFCSRPHKLFKQSSRHNRRAIYGYQIESEVIEQERSPPVLPSPSLRHRSGEAQIHGTTLTNRTIVVT